MDAGVDELFHAALALPAENRADLAEKLLASLPEDKANEAAWLIEAESRLEAYRRGEIAATPGETVLESLRSRRTKAEKIRQRLLKHVQATPDGCWLWIGATTWGQGQEDTPYGSIQVAGRRVSARRLSYELFRGRLGDEVIDCTCGNSLCVNPRHLVRSSRKKSQGRESKRKGQKGLS